MQMEVSFGSRSFSADILDGILDCFWTAHEPEDHLLRLFGTPNPYGVHSEELLEFFAKFNTFLSLSLTCSTLRQLCLPRLFGTIHITRFKTLGLLWRSIQSNPKLGSYVHSFTLRIQPLKWPMIVEPSDGLDVIFEGQTMEDLLFEVEKLHPGAWNNEIRREMKGYCRKGPDGAGIDSNLKNAGDLKEALVTIFRSFSNLNTLKWKARGVPFLTPVIEHLEQLDCLRRVTMDVSCCEEDFFYSEPPPEGTLHPASKSDGSDLTEEELPRDHRPLTKVLTLSLTLCEAPLWRLSKNIRELDVHGSGPGLTDFHLKDINDRPDETEAGPRLQRRTEVLIKTIDEAENLEETDLASLGYLGEDEKRPEILLAIIPRLCCVPKITFKARYIADEWEKWDVPLLYPALLSLSERKGTLKAEDVRSLGKDAEKSIDHPLSAFASFLQEEELSEKIVDRWNKRYSRV